jgi:hypothetical protein
MGNSRIAALRVFGKIPFNHAGKPWSDDNSPRGG